MSRLPALYCNICHGVVDWGDFGPEPLDGSVGTTCECVCSCRTERKPAHHATAPVNVVTLDRECPFHGGDPGFVRVTT